MTDFGINTNVFVCCAPNDEPFAERLEAALRWCGLQTLPRTTTVYPERNFRSMEFADVLLLVVSHSWFEAERAARELMFTSVLNLRRGRPVLAIWIEEDVGLADNDPVFFWLTSLYGVHIPAEDEFVHGVNQLVGLVSGLKPTLATVLTRDVLYSRPGDPPGRPGPDRATRIHERAREIAQSSHALGELENWFAAQRDVDHEIRMNMRWGNGDEVRLAGLSAEIKRQRFAHLGDYELPPATAEVMAAAAQHTAATHEDVVDCSVFAPSVCAPNIWIFVQVYFHTPVQAPDAAALAEEFDPGTTRRGFSGLQLRIPRDSVLDVELDIKGLRFEEPIQRLIWRGRAEAVQFDVEIPADQAEGPLPGAVVVRRAGIPVGRVGFRVTVEHKPKYSFPSHQAAEPVRFRSAFISYASSDRDEVLRRVQTLQAVGIAFFQDLLSLDPGARWKPEIYRHIDESDLFLLFWSKAAKNSKWVRREADRALQLQLANPRQLPEIRPVILGRPVVIPWKELRHLHFNDRLVFLMED